MSAPIHYTDQRPDPFLDQLRKKIEAMTARPEIRRRARIRMTAKVVTYFVGLAISYGALVTSGGDNTVALAGAIGFGLFSLMLALNIGHDAAHVSFTGNRRIDRIVQIVVFSILGVDGDAWRIRHTTQHHPYPNIDGADSDTEANILLRLTPAQPLKSCHRYQFLYAPAVYCILLVHTVLWQDFMWLFQRHQHPRRHHTPSRYVRFFAGKIFYLIIVFVIPPEVTHLSTLQVITGYLAMSFVASIIFVFLLIGTHLSAMAEFPRPDAKGLIHHSWPLHAFKTTVDWNPHNRFAGFLVGGTNAHVIHHLFPRLSSVYYPEAARILEETAAEFHMPYRHTNFLGVMIGHMKFLWKIGRETDTSDLSSPLVHDSK